MANRRGRFLLLVGALLCAAVSPVRAAGKPLVLLFAAGRPVAAPAAEKKPAADAVDETERARVAVRAVRQAFDEEAVVEAVAFTFDSPTFQRALRESQVKLARDAEPTEDERLRIGAAAGAAYVVAIFSRLSSETESKHTEMEMEAVEVRAGRATVAGRRWKDKIQVGDNTPTTLVTRQPGASDGLRTAARTLVLRFLSGPLRDLRTGTPSPGLLPVGAPPPTESAADAAEESDPQEQAALVRRNGEALLKEGNVEEGIRALRRAVNLAPRSMAGRAALIRAYLAAGQTEAAAEETRRALSVAAPDDAAGRKEIADLIPREAPARPDPASARSRYEELLKTDPANVAAHLALGELLMTQEELAGAEAHFRAARQAAPDNRDAALGIARAVASRGDYEAALKELDGDPATRHQFATGLFLEVSLRIARRIVQNRTAWEEGKLSREAFYAATRTQSQRASALPALLVSAPPPAGVAEIVTRAHKHRVLAASLLSQSVATLLGYLETGESPAGAQARVLLDEFFVEIKDAASPAASR